MRRFSSLAEMLALLFVAALAPHANAEENTGIALIPRLLLSGSVATATYAEASYNQLNDTEGRLDAVKMSGSEARFGLSFGQFYGLEINYRSLTPKDVAHWSQRNEIGAVASLYIPMIEWLQPAIGYFQVTQTGDNTAVTAPPAFITKNDGMSFGVRTRFNVYKMDAQGIMAHARIDYLTSLEAKTNFGLEYSYGLGYYTKWDSVAFTIIGGLTRNQFNASKSDPADTDGTHGLDGGPAKLTVQHRYEAFKIGIEMSY